MKYDKTGMNTETKKILFYDRNMEVEGVYELGENSKIVFAIDIYTQMVHKNIFKKLLLRKIANKFNVDVNNIVYNDELKRHEYILENGEIITFELLSEHLKSVNKELINELESQKRKGQCHSKSLFLGIANEKSNILTGYYTFENETALHSVVEIIDENGNPKILDWTRNLIIDEDIYVKLFKFNTITKIDSSLVFDEIESLAKLDIDLKTYLTFRDELLKDMEKNPQIFGNREQTKTSKK